VFFVTKSEMLMAHDVWRFGDWNGENDDEVIDEARDSGDVPPIILPCDVGLRQFV
jgi:hypothetical protein